MEKISKKLFGTKDKVEMHPHDVPITLVVMPLIIVFKLLDVLLRVDEKKRMPKTIEWCESYA